MNMNKVFANDELKVGKYYHCYDKSNGVYDVIKCCEDSNGVKYMNYNCNRIYADDENNQALEKWMMVPVEPPKSVSMYLCFRHGGYGFVSDCIVCKNKG